MLGPGWNAVAPGSGIHQVRQQSSLSKDSRDWKNDIPGPFANHICFIQTVVSFWLQKVSRTYKNKFTVKAHINVLQTCYSTIKRVQNTLTHTIRIQLIVWIDAFSKVVQAMQECHFNCFSFDLAPLWVSPEWWSLGKKEHFEKENQLGIFNTISDWLIILWILYTIWNDADII